MWIQQRPDHFDLANPLRGSRLPPGSSGAVNAATYYPCLTNPPNTDPISVRMSSMP